MPLRILAAVLALSLALSPTLGRAQAFAPPSPYLKAQQTNPLNSLKLRVGPPALPFGPTAISGDVMPTFIPKAGGGFYVFGSNQTPWETTATGLLTGYSGTGAGATAQTVGHNYNAAGASRFVTYSSNWSIPFTGAFTSGTTTPGALAATAPGVSTDQCGAWPTSAYKVGSTWYLLVHNEGPCDYVNPLGPGQIGYTNESMSIWTSATGAPGTWTPLSGSGSPGTIISSAMPLEPGWLTGFGDGTMIPSDDGQWMYAYTSFFCDNSICDYHNAVARAPISALAPGNWKFYYQGCFCAPALNAPWNALTNLPNADLFPFIGSSIATMPGTPYKALAVDGKDHSYWKGWPGQNIAGVGLSIALDYINFYTFPAPIINYDHSFFVGRPSPDDLYLYTTLRNDLDGSSSIASGHFSLWGVFIPPNNSLASRYYIQWPVTASQMSVAEQASGVPQIGLALTTWANTGGVASYNSASLNGRKRTTTVNPYASIGGDGATETGWAATATLGYLTTDCPASNLRLDDCDAVGAGIANRIEECWASANDDYQLEIDLNGKTGSCAAGWAHVRTAGWLYRSPQAFPTNEIDACYDSGGALHFAVANDPTCGGKTFLARLGYALAN